MKNEKKRRRRKKKKKQKSKDVIVIFTVLSNQTRPIYYGAKMCNSRGYFWLRVLLTIFPNTIHLLLPSFPPYCL